MSSKVACKDQNLKEAGPQVVLPPQYNVPHCLHLQMVYPTFALHLNPLLPETIEGTLQFETVIQNSGPPKKFIPAASFTP